MHGGYGVRLLSFFDLPSRVTDDMPRMLMGWKCK